MVLTSVDGPAREHPEAAHEARRRVAPDEQQLDAALAVADDDQRGRLPGRGRLALMSQALAGRRSLDDAKV
jgi:hypothetical protein